MSKILSIIWSIAKAWLNSPTPLPPQSITEPKPETIAWLDWFIFRLGWSEFDHDAELSKGWKYTSVPNYKSVIGIEHAWCAMSMNTALEENGYTGTKSAAAKSFMNFGNPSELKRGAIVLIRHATGSYHVTLFIKKEGNILTGLGGNQNNRIKYMDFDVSGNDQDCDEIVAVRWPSFKNQ